MLQKIATGYFNWLIQHFFMIIMFLKLCTVHFSLGSLKLEKMNSLIEDSKLHSLWYITDHSGALSAILHKGKYKKHICTKPNCCTLACQKTASNCTFHTTLIPRLCLILFVLLSWHYNPNTIILADT